MMNRASAGIGAMMRGGGRPKAGLGGMRAHVAPGEMILPREAMAQSPGLRYHAAQSMARQGRDPSRYTVGGRNSRNPGTGMWEFADYVNGQWVDSTTGQAVDYSSSAGDTHDVSAPTTSGVQDTLARMTADLLGHLDNAQSGYGAPGYEGGAEASGVYPESDMMPVLTQARDNLVANVQNTAPAPTPAPSPAPAPAPEPSAPTVDYNSWNAPQTFDAWRDTRNPSGKNIPNILYGQVSGAGTEASPFTPTFGSPTNALSGQLPAQMAGWTLPGTSGLGMARDSGADEASILNSGYQGISMLPGAFSNPMAGWMSPFGNMNGGITSSGFAGNPGAPTGSYGGNDFKSAFRY